MKTKLVDTVTSNEGLVRLKIFDGDIPLHKAGSELLELNTKTHINEIKRLNEIIIGLYKTIEIQKYIRENC